MRKKKWLLRCCYNAHKNQTSNHLKEIERNIDNFSSNYNNLILLGGFKVEPTEKHMKHFSLIYNYENIIWDKTCYKDLENPECIDLILINTPKYFQNSQAIKTGLSDFHKMCLTVLKVFEVIQYRCYKKCSNEAFMNDL